MFPICDKTRLFDTNIALPTGREAQDGIHLVFSEENVETEGVIGLVVACTSLAAEARGLKPTIR